MAQITYDDKVALNENSSVAEINKVTDDNMNEIKDTINTNTPVGVISLFSGTTAPNGWLICDGSAVSRTTYANLFSVIGTTYGTGDGSTTFNIPDLQGRVPVGYKSTDASFDTIGETGGEKSHQLTHDELPTIRYFKGDIDSYDWGNALNVSLPAGNVYGLKYPYVGHNYAHNNLQPYIVMNYIISY